MPIIREFTRGVSTAESSMGEAGWIMKGMENFDPLYPEQNGTGGMLLAHDVLEHFSPTDTSLEAEFLAFGSMLYLRGESDWWSACGNGRGNTDPVFNMYGDIARFCLDAHYDGTNIRKPRAKRLDDDLEEMLSRLYVEALRSIADMDSDSLVRWGARKTLKRAIAYMRVGYRNARDRWNMGNGERLDLFESVRNLVLPDIGEYEVAGFKVVVEPKTLHARIDLIYEEFDFGDEDEESNDD